MKDQYLISDSNIILKAFSGSRLYGTDLPESDIDYVGIFIPPKELVFGLNTVDQFHLNELIEGKKIDYTCYSLIKFIKLAINNNPNIISLLYTPESHIVSTTSYGELLLLNRELFLSKKAYITFKGYAKSQINKLTKKQRIGSRKEIVEKFGYDTKDAMHLLRLLYECLDILVCKEIKYPSNQKDFFLRVRKGEIELEHVLSEALKLEAFIDEAYLKSDLQENPDIESIEKLQIAMLENYWYSK